MWILIEHTQITRSLNRTIRAPKLHRHNHQSNQPHNEEDKRANHDNCRQQAPLGDEPENAANEEESDAAHGDVVYEVP